MQSDGTAAKHQRQIRGKQLLWTQIIWLNLFTYFLYIALPLCGLICINNVYIFLRNIWSNVGPFGLKGKVFNSLKSEL